MKKFVALTLALLMVLSLLPVMALADGETLAEKVAAAEVGAVITLTADEKGPGIVINKSVTIDLAGFTYTIEGQLVGSKGTTTNGFQILQEAGDVTIKNGKIDLGDSFVTGDVNAGNKNECRLLIQNYANLTLDNVILDGSKLTDSRDGRAPYTLSNNSGKTVINDTTIIAAEGGYAFDSYDSPYYNDVPTVTVSGESVINGLIDTNSTGNAGKIVVNGGTFTDPNAAKYVAEGFVLLPYEDKNAGYEVIDWTTPIALIYAEASITPPALTEKTDAAVKKAIESIKAYVANEDGKSTVEGFSELSVSAISTVHFAKCQDAANEAIAEIDARLEGMGNKAGIIVKLKAEKAKKTLQLVPELVTIYSIKANTISEMEKVSLVENTTLGGLALGLSLIGGIFANKMDKTNEVTLLTQILSMTTGLLSFFGVLFGK